MDNIFRVQRFSAELFSEPLGEENKSRKSLNEENMSILYEESCDNLFIVNILFFICNSSYNVKDIDVTKHVVAMVVTASKTSKSYVINQFHFQRSNFKIFATRKSYKESVTNTIFNTTKYRKVIIH